MFLIQVLIWVAVGLIGGRIFARKGYPPIAGVFGGLMCGPIGLLVAACLPRTAEASRQADMEFATRRELAKASVTRPCPNCGRMNSVATPVCARCDHRFADSPAVQIDPSG